MTRCSPATGAALSPRNYFYSFAICKYIWREAKCQKCFSMFLATWRNTFTECICKVAQHFDNVLVVQCLGTQTTTVRERLWSTLNIEKVATDLKRGCVN